MNKTSKLFSLVISGAIMVLALGCGESEPKPVSAEPAPPPPFVGEPARFEITANDTMKFDTTAIEVQPGQPVTIVLKNVGNTPKFSMGHNLIVLKNGVDPVTFVTACAQFPAQEYVSPDEKGNIIASTKLLGPGESDEIQFTAPRQTGDYDYVCSFPGHFQVGMRGVMTVK